MTTRGIDHLPAQGIGVEPVAFSQGWPGRTEDAQLTFVNMHSQLLWKFREALGPVQGDGIGRTAGARHVSWCRCGSSARRIAATGPDPIGLVVDRAEQQHRGRSGQGGSEIAEQRKKSAARRR